MKIVITSPSLDVNQNVSGISSVTNFIIDNNEKTDYLHFQIGKADGKSRNITWFFDLLRIYLSWVFLLFNQKNKIFHFNIAVDKFALLRDAPLILLAQLFRVKLVIHLHGGEL